MRTVEELDVRDLALLGGLKLAAGDDAMPVARALDADGDGRNDLFLVDFDLDGRVDAVVRALDVDGDGVNDIFVHYDADGEVHAFGRLDRESGEFEVLAEDSDEFADLLSSPDLAEAPIPDAALFTDFDGPYLVDAFGGSGEAVPDYAGEEVGLGDAALGEVDAEELASLDGAEIVDAADTVSPEPEEANAASEDDALPEVTPRVVEIEDYSGAGDGSDLHAKIDQDGDGLGDDDLKLFRTSDGTWHGDVDRDGYSDAVAFDLDQDGRVESVDTAGQGSSADMVGAEQLVAPESEEIIDRQQGDDAWSGEAEAAEPFAVEEDHDAGDEYLGSTGDLELEGSDDLDDAEMAATTADTTTADPTADTEP